MYNQNRPHHNHQQDHDHSHFRQRGPGHHPPHGGEGRGERGGFGGREFGRGGRGGSHHGGHGEPGGRARRGEAKYLLLDALKGGPKHGYEIIKAMEERSGGRWAPSPGTVYPTLQFLEDAGLVRANSDAERRIFQITETGLTELTEHAEEVAAFWARMTVPTTSAASQTETGFLNEELESLSRTIWSGLRVAQEQGDHETIRRIRKAVESCRESVRSVLAGESA